MSYALEEILDDAIISNVINENETELLNPEEESNDVTPRLNLKQAAEQK